MLAAVMVGLIPSAADAHHTPGFDSTAIGGPRLVNRLENPISHPLDVMLLEVGRALRGL